tara:strand:+ start:365 stop:2476 length:2112 start_codon:yes stop_codon:yes gene_type:complete
MFRRYYSTGGEGGSPKGKEPHKPTCRTVFCDWAKGRLIDFSSNLSSFHSKHCLENWYSLKSKALQAKQNIMEGRKKYPPSFLVHLLTKTRYEFTVKDSPRVTKIISSPRSFMLVLGGAFITYAGSNYIRLQNHLAHIEEEFQEIQDENREVLSDVSRGIFSIPDYYTDPRYSDEALSQYCSKITQRCQATENLGLALDRAIPEEKPLFGTIPCYIRRMVNWFLESDRAAIQKPIDQELFYLRSFYLLSSILRELPHSGPDSKYIADSVDKLLTFEDRYISSFKGEKPEDKEKEEDGEHENVSAQDDAKDLILGTANVLGFIEARKCVKNPQVCSEAVRFFEIAAERASRERVKSYFQFNKGFLKYSYMSELKEGETALQNSYKASPENVSSVVTNLVYCQYLQERLREDQFYQDSMRFQDGQSSGSTQKSKRTEPLEQIFPELIAPLKAVILDSPNDYLARQIYAVLLIQQAVWSANKQVTDFGDSPQSMIWKAKAELDFIEDKREKGELKGFVADQYYYFPKAQIEAASGDYTSALESLRYAKFLIQKDNLENQIQEDNLEEKIIRGAIQEIEKPPYFSFCRKSSLISERLDKFNFMRAVIDFPSHNYTPGYLPEEGSSAGGAGSQETVSDKSKTNYEKIAALLDSVDPKRPTDEGSGRSIISNFIRYFFPTENEFSSQSRVQETPVGDQDEGSPDAPVSTS